MLFLTFSLMFKMLLFTAGSCQKAGGGDSARNPKIGSSTVELRQVEDKLRCELAIVVEFGHMLYERGESSSSVASAHKTFTTGTTVLASISRFMFV